MSQILDPLPNGENNRVLCCYVNPSSRIQIARITNIPNWYFERVVFPQQRMVFEAVPEGLLEIHCGMMASAILSDTIPCERLCVEDAKNLPSRAAMAEPPASENNQAKVNSSVEIPNSKTTVSV